MRRIRLSWMVALLAVALLFPGCKKKKTVKKEEAPVSVELGRVTRGTIKEFVRFTGDLEGEAMVSVYSAVADRIRDLRVDVGDVVQKGQVIAVIEHSRLRQVVAQSQAQLAMVRSQLAGARVSLAGAKVAQASAKKEYARLRRLLRSGAVGAQQVDLSKVQFQGSVTKVQAAISQVSALRSQIRAIQAQVAQARTAKSNAVVRAPISGIIAQRLRQTGDMNLPQVALVSIVRMDLVKVNIQVTEKDLAKVKIGDKAEVSVAGHPGRIFAGTVRKMAPTLSMDTRTAAAELVINNIYPVKPLRSCKKDSDCAAHAGTHCYRLGPPPKDKKRRRRKMPTYCVEKHPLKPGMIAKVRLLAKTFNDALLIPSSAILNDSYGYGSQRQNQTLAVMVLGADNKPVRRKVEIGLESKSGMLQVLSGLRFGEKVLTSGHNLYRPGRKIRIVNEGAQAGQSAAKGNTRLSQKTNLAKKSASN